MFGTIRKHQTWLWAVIIAAIIISFVYYFSPNSKMNSGQRGSADYGSINGERVTDEQFASAWKDIHLRYFFNNGRFPDTKTTGFEPERETYQWLLMLQKADAMGIKVGPQDVGRVAQAMISQFQRSGISSPEVFLHQVLQPSGFSVDDLERFVRRYLSIQELIGTVGLSGKLVTAEEAKGLYEREHQDMATEMVYFSASNYLSSVAAPAEAISQFYSNRLAYYRIPDRIQVTYVKFPVSNYTAQAEAELMKTNFNEQIDTELQRIGTNYLQLGKTHHEAKAKLRDLRITQVARFQARRAANAFATPLMEIDPPRASNLAVFAQTNGLKVNVTAPFDRETGPQDLDVTIEAAQRLFSLSTNQPIAPPIVGDSAVYIIALDKKLPSEVPPLDQIRQRVIEDYKTFQAISHARMQGVAFDSALTNELAQGKSFSSICLNAHLKPVPLPPFSLSTQELPELEGRLSMNQLKQLAFTTPVGKASGFQPTVDGGVILYVKSKLPMDMARMSAELPAFINRVRMNRENDAFNEWFRKEAEKGLSTIPALRPPPNMTPGTTQKRT